MALVITIKDKYNFILSEPLDKPISTVVNFGGNEVTVVATHKHRKVFYGRLSEAIKGLSKHSKVDISKYNIPKEYESITPDIDMNGYSGLLDAGIDQIMENYLQPIECMTEDNSSSKELV